MHDSKHHRSHEITIRRCTEGCIVLQFGLTMVHLDEPIFKRFAQIVMATSVQIDQDEKLRRIRKLEAKKCPESMEYLELERGFEA